MNNSESYSGENLGRCIGELLFTDHPSQEALVLASSHGMQKGAGLGSNPGQCVWVDPQMGFVGSTAFYPGSAMPTKISASRRETSVPLPPCVPDWKALDLPSMPQLPPLCLVSTGLWAEWNPQKGACVLSACWSGGEGKLGLGEG